MISIKPHQCGRLREIVNLHEDSARILFNYLRKSVYERRFVLWNKIGIFSCVNQFKGL